ncbi:HAD hydrolase-like protein [Staphylococcus canis]|uniref:HAD family hydrolase n=1 Tax=Staphylococcus canis TaxID=2724942 RepID=A0ABS0T674_9STAP|nr:HAD hydrolase-like protein [Staphylococcus canis]MBI5974251.1 HAD family hydrolase [Staphylococcus canis]
MTKAILFDVDGVFLDESRCFDVSALTVFELLYDQSYLNLDSSIDLKSVSESEIQEIRQEIFNNDITLNRLKSLGLNSNWDMLFVVFAVHFAALLKSLPKDVREHFLNQTHIHQETLKNLGYKMTVTKIDNELPLRFVEKVSKGKEAIYQDLKRYVSEFLDTTAVHLFDIQSSLWMLCQEIYQEWYLGSDLYAKVEGKTPRTKFKKGYIYQEQTLAPVDQIKALLTYLTEKNYTLGIATGRPRTETIVPFESLGLLKYFDVNHIATASEVLKTEMNYPELRPLAKPNPFTYITSYLGNDEKRYEDYATHQEQRFKEETITIVGDSLADLFSAQKLGTHFIGTLTGLKGELAAEELKSHGATHLVKNVLDIKAFF